MGQRYGDSNFNHFYIGYMDDVRISTVRRWLANFAPPDELHTQDADTHFLLRSDSIEGSQNFEDIACFAVPARIIGVIAFNAWLVNNHGLLPEFQAWLIKHDLPDFIYRSWKMLNKGPTEAAFQMQNDILLTLFNAWQLINHSKIDASEAWLLKNFIDAVDKASNSWNMRNQLGATPIIPPSQPVVDWSVTIDGIDITRQIEDININLNEDAFVNTCELSFSDLSLQDQFAPISRDKTERIAVTIRGDVYKFLFEERDTDIEIVNRDFTFWGRSRPAILGKPYSDVIVDEFEPEGFASEVIARYTNAENINLTYSIDDYYIGPSALFINEKTPLQIITEVVEAGGGIIRSDRVNRLIIRNKYPDLDTINLQTPDHEFTDIVSIVSLNEEELLSEGLNAVLVEGNVERINSLSGRFVLDAERNAGESVRPIGTPMYVRLYLFPISSPSIDTNVANYPSSVYTVETSAGTFTFQGTIQETVTNEIVEIVQGEGSLEFPALSIQSVTWLGTNIGTISLESAGDNLLKLTPNGTRTVGIATITYISEYDLYITQGTDPQAAILVAALKEGQ
jgi:hypothetical protein